MQRSLLILLSLLSLSQLSHATPNIDGELYYESLLQTCGKLKYGDTFTISLKCVGNCTLLSTEEILDYLILQHTENPSIKIQTRCQVYSHSLQCTLKNNVFIEGPYRVDLIEDMTFESTVLLHKFHSKEYKYFTLLPYNKPDIDVKYNYDFDYSESWGGKIDVIFNDLFDDTVDIFPIISANNQTFDCEPQGNVLSCSFTAGMLPKKFMELMTYYKGEITNVCGFKEDVVININIFNTIFEEVPIITIKGVNYERKCVEKMDKEFLFFSLDYESSIGKIEEVIDIKEKIILQNVNVPIIRYPVDCTLDPELPKIECNMLQPNEFEGFYKVVLEKDVKVNGYKIKAFSSQNFTSFISGKNVNSNKDYYLVKVDYKDNDKVSFDIDFMDDLMEPLPKVIVDNVELKCAGNNKILTCEFDKFMFPYAYDDYHYYGKVVNNCGYETATVDIYPIGE